MTPRAATLLAGAFLAGVLGGCAAPARRPAPPQAAPSSPDTPQGSPQGSSSSSTAAAIADGISRLVRDRTKTKEQVNTIVLGNIALVAVGNPDKTPTPGPATPGVPPTAQPRRPTAPTPPPPGPNVPPGAAPRTGAPGGVAPPTVPPPGPAPGPRYTPRPGTTSILDTRVTAEITRRYPMVIRVYSTNDPVLVARIASVARDVRNRRPLDQRIDEVAWIVRAMTGPTGAAPGSPPPATPS